MSPLYTFDCECGNDTVDILKSIKEIDEHKEVCSKCGKNMRRVMSGCTFKIKGNPPQGYTPLQKSKPQSQVKSVHQIRRVENQ